MSLTGGGGGSGAAPPKNNKLVEWFKDKLNCFSNAVKCLVGKAVAALAGIIGSVFEAILNFFPKAAAFVATHVCAFLVFVIGLVATWVYTTHRSNK